MIDRGKAAHERQQHGQLHRRLRLTDQQRGHADTNEKHQHHLAPSPLVAELACREGTDTKKEESGCAIRHQVFPACHAHVGGDAADGGREDQQEHMVECMREIQQQGYPGVIHRSHELRSGRAADIVAARPA